MTTSAGLFLFRRDASGGLEVLLGHMGGPFWVRKDAAAWSIPKGELEPGEDALAAARREFAEELGLAAPDVPLVDLGDVRMSSGKRVQAWAGEADVDPTVPTAEISTFELEWPPRSGRVQRFPEIDRAAWCDLAAARERIVRGQLPFLDRLINMLCGDKITSGEAGPTGG